MSGRQRPELETGTPSRQRAVFLVGFMGAGKTTVGRALGQRLNWLFEDLDDRIVLRESRSVAEIFRDSGEEEFRRAEHAALRELLDELRAGAARVIALGGGAFAQQRNAALLKDAGVPTVLLEAPVETLWRRCCEHAKETGAERPLLASIDHFRQLYEKRREAYAQASMKVATEGRSVESVAAEIAAALGQRQLAFRSEEGEME